MGLELIEPGDEDWLYDIQTDNCNDANMCCKEMFWFWLSEYPNASWSQLIQALKEPHIQLHDLASRIEAMLMPMDEIIKGKLYVCRSTYIWLHLILKDSSQMDSACIYIM